jgi:hypothetical protein
MFDCTGKHSEAESKEKHGVWDPVPELTVTSPYIQVRVNVIVDLNPMPESTLSPQPGTLDLASDFDYLCIN